MEVYVQHKNQRLVLTAADFRASGGQADVYVKAGIACKVYHDPQCMVPAGKIAELAPLALPTIVKPEDILLDGKHRAVGYTMRAVADALPLVQTFTRAFRDREGLTPEKVVPLVRKLRDGVQHVHDRNLLIVDLNEMNFLVAPDFAALYFIDVDSYQTPHYPAPVLMESVRDRHANGAWSTGTDWFSFAVVSFQMFVGIHPYKGKHSKITGMDDRMRANVSVLHRDVSVPAAALPLSVIPSNYLRWYRAVLEEGQRIAPPDGPIDRLVLAPVVHRQQGSGVFTIMEIAEYDGEIVHFVRGVVLTTEGVYQGTRRLAALPAPGCRVALTPQNHVVLGWLENGAVRLYDATQRQPIPVTLDADALMETDRRLIVKRGTLLLEIAFVPVGTKLLAQAKHIANVAAQATQLFAGVAIQNLLGTYYASIFPEPFQCRQQRVPELDGYRILDSRCDRNVLLVVGERAGMFSLFVLRFAAAWDRYDLRVVPDIPYAAPNIAVLDSGICVHLAPSESVEVFRAQPGCPALKEVSDPAVRGDVHLYTDNGRVLFARGKRLYHLSLRP